MSIYLTLSGLSSSLTVSARLHGVDVDHRLAGVIAKFNRSKEQFDALLDEMDAFFNADPKPHTSVGEFDTDAWEWVERFRVHEEPPLRFGVMLGDCVHNLRSALDHLMWQVTLLDGNVPGDATQFPIASKSEGQFEAMADHRVPGLSAEHRARLKTAQPYNAGDRAHLHPLSALATLSNTDKHRVLNTAVSVNATDAQEVLNQLLSSGFPPNVHAVWVVSKGTRLKDGTPWLRIGWDRGEEPPREVQVHGGLDLGIAFGDIGLDAMSFHHVGKYVLKVIQGFMADFPETVWEDGEGSPES